MSAIKPNINWDNEINLISIDEYKIAKQIQEFRPIGNKENPFEYIMLANGGELHKWWVDFIKIIPDDNKEICKRIRKQIKKFIFDDKYYFLYLEK